MLLILGFIFLSGAIFNELGYLEITPEMVILSSISCLFFSVASIYSFENKYNNALKLIFNTCGLFSVILIPMLKKDIQHKLLEFIGIKENTVLLLSISFALISIGISSIADEQRRYKYKEILEKIYSDLKNRGSK
ncbi:MAG: hypothetical protein ACRCZH_07800 [Cetobacterium sp.]